MAREIVTNVWCDVCLGHDDTYTEATETPPIIIGSHKPRVLALCEVHLKEFYEPLKHTLVELGQVQAQQTQGVTKRPAGSQPVLAEPYTCRIPDCPKFGHVYQKRTALVSHLERVHDLTLKAYGELHPEALRPTRAGGPQSPKAVQQPGTAKAAYLVELPEEDWRCGEPGCDAEFPPDQYTHPKRVVAIHRAKSHGIRSQKPEAEPEQAQLPTGQYACPECGKTDFASPSDQAVRMHRVRAHGYRKAG